MNNFLCQHIYVYLTVNELLHYFFLLSNKTNTCRLMTAVNQKVFSFPAAPRSRSLPFMCVHENSGQLLIYSAVQIWIKILFLHCLFSHLKCFYEHNKVYCLSRRKKRLIWQPFFKSEAPNSHTTVTCRHLLADWRIAPLRWKSLCLIQMVIPRFLLSLTVKRL